MRNTSTICAIATAQGGAMGIIRVSGPESISIVDSIFHGRCSLLDAKGYTVHYGQILNTSSNSAPSLQGDRGHSAGGSFPTGESGDRGLGEPALDEVLVTVFRAPYSYTGEDCIEISCHGSSYILHSIMSLLIKQGCTQAGPGEYTQRAFLNGKMDLSQAEAVADLISSQNAAQHRIAMSQLRGGISSKLSVLHDKLLHLTSLLELELDFSDHEDLEFADRTELLSIAQQVSQEITHLRESFKQGNAIKNGIPVAIIGAPNVGKSTLLNALLQEDKAIVSDIQGTTRDTIEDTIFISSPRGSRMLSTSEYVKQKGAGERGFLFRFIDTAGIRKTEDKIENLGIERSLKAAEKAQIIIMMAEPGVDFPAIEKRDDQKVIRILNKSEEFQAINGKGLDKLKQQLLSLVSAADSGSAVIITSLRHLEALNSSYEDITRVIEAIELSVSGDLIAEDLRQCIYHLSSIVGKDLIDPQTTLNSIFKNFCIGK